MLSYESQSSSKFHSFFNKENKSEETETKIDFVLSIWYNDHILRLDENNWQCLWFTIVFQLANSAKALSNVLVRKGMHIKRFYVPKNKAHITRYQELHQFKQAWKGILIDYSAKIEASISSLQNNSSDDIKYTIHCSSKSITLSNYTNSSEMSGFSSASNITTESNSRSI